MALNINVIINPRIRTKIVAAITYKTGTHALIWIESDARPEKKILMTAGKPDHCTGVTAGR